jgi:hypothetical protein
MTRSTTTKATKKERPGHPQMEALVCSFPTLRGAAGASPWDQHRFAKWASRGGHLTNANRQAAAFVLAVWNGGEPETGEAWYREAPYNVVRFDVVSAMAVWDACHAAAFAAWVNKPFFP